MEFIKVKVLSPYLSSEFESTLISTRLIKYVQEITAPDNFVCSYIVLIGGEWLFVRESVEQIAGLIGETDDPHFTRTKELERIFSKRSSTQH